MCTGSGQVIIDGACKCPGNQKLDDNNKCICPAQGQIADPITGACGCPGSQVLNNNVCTDPGM